MKDDPIDDVMKKETAKACPGDRPVVAKAKISTADVPAMDTTTADQRLREFADQVNAITKSQNVPMPVIAGNVDEIIRMMGVQQVVASVVAQNEQAKRLALKTPDCLVDLGGGENWSWSGDCTNGIANGYGELRSTEGRRRKFQGNMVNGKEDGVWRAAFYNGDNTWEEYDYSYRGGELLTAKDIRTGKVTSMQDDEPDVNVGELVAQGLNQGMQETQRMQQQWDQAKAKQQAELDARNQQIVANAQAQREQTNQQYQQQLAQQQQQREQQRQQQEQQQREYARQQQEQQRQQEQQHKQQEELAAAGANQCVQLVRESPNTYFKNLCGQDMEIQYKTSAGDYAGSTGMSTVRANSSAMVSAHKDTMAAQWVWFACFHPYHPSGSITGNDNHCVQ
jgi:hypothetical protein